MTTPDDEHPVEAFRADGAYDPLADGIRPRRPDRGRDDPDAFCSEHGVEGPGELSVPIADEELGRAHLLGEAYADVAGLPGHLLGDRLGRHGSDSGETGVVVDEQQHVEPAEQDGFGGEKVADDQALGLCGEKLGPRWP